MEDLGKSLPGAEGAVEVEQSGQPAGNPNCLNCGATLSGKFCSQCGQKDLPRRQTLSDLFVNFLSSFTSFDSKLLRTFKVLLFKPGFIINEYTAGKRETYFHPARMYVFLSFVFFLLFSLLPNEKIVQMENDGKELTPQEKKELLDSIQSSLDSIPNVPVRINEDDYDAQTLAEYDSLELTKPEDKRDGWLERYFSRKYLGLREKNGGSEKVFWENFSKRIADNIPQMIFFLLPVFALILKLLYVRRDYYYSEHLIFTVFFYDFMFMIGIVAILCSLVPWLEWMQLILMLWIFFYLYKSMRKFYKQSRGKTILKYFLLLGLMFVSLMAAFVVNAIITLIML